MKGSPVRVRASALGIRGVARIGGTKWGTKAEMAMAVRPESEGPHAKDNTFARVPCVPIRPLRDAPAPPNRASGSNPGAPIEESPRHGGGFGGPRTAPGSIRVLFGCYFMAVPNRPPNVAALFDQSILLCTVAGALLLCGVCGGLGSPGSRLRSAVNSAWRSHGDGVGSLESWEDD